MRIRRAALLTLLIAASVVSAQPAPRRATNLAAIAAFPGFFHQRPVVLVGPVTTSDRGESRVGDDELSVPLVVKGMTVPAGMDEVRGEFWDLGRMKADDPRLAGYDLQATFHIDREKPWPKPGEVTAIITSSLAAVQPPVAPSIRNIVLEPRRYLDQRVTVLGQFSGRNLFGELPEAPAKGKWDFVIRSGDAAIWVTGARPKGKTFDFDIERRLDSGRWLEISGVVRQGHGLQWIEATQDGVALGKAPQDTELNAGPEIKVAPAPPPEVVFSAPTQDESDVSLGAQVRIQFSRDINPTTLKDHVRVSYLTEQTRERGEPVTPAAEFTLQYVPANRELVIKFSKPLERFRTVKVELTREVIGTDTQPLVPWTLTFGTGGS